MNALVTALHRPEPSAFFLFVSVNVLNLCDAILTHVALTSGVAAEANPVAESLGAGGKIAVVLIASAGIVIAKPKALWIPIVALALVVTYTATGLVLSSV